MSCIFSSDVNTATKYKAKAKDKAMHCNVMVKALGVVLGLQCQVQGDH